MVRETDHHHEENNNPGRGIWGKATDALRHLLTDPPHDPGEPPVGPGPLGLEWK